jgi:integrase
MSRAAILESSEFVTEPKKSKPKHRGPRGMGSVWQPTYRLPNGEKRKSAYYWISFNNETGRINENSGYTTKDGARERLKERLAQIQSGDFEGYQRYRDVTLKQIADDLRAQYRTKGRRSTAKLERSLTRLEKHFGENCPVTRITPERIEEYRVYRRAEDSSPSEPTIARELAALKAALRLGFKNDRVKKVPHIEMPDERDRIEEGEFSPEQVTSLLAQLEAKPRSAYLAPLVRFLYRTGMRAQEPMGMKWSEVRLDLKTLRLPGRRTKNKDAKPLTLDGQVLTLIKGQRQLCDKTFPGCEFVFPNREGGQIVYDRALDQFQAACKRAEITEGFTTWDGQPRQPGFHDLRRTFAREADRCSVPHSEIMRIAGWKTYSMLLRYLGASEDRQRAAFAKMDEGFGKLVISQSSK